MRTLSWSGGRVDRRRERAELALDGDDRGQVGAFAAGVDEHELRVEAAGGHGPVHCGPLPDT